jgi:hypothetical protein
MNHLFVKSRLWAFLAFVSWLIGSGVTGALALGFCASALASEPTAKIGVKGEIEVRQDALPTLIFRPSFFVEERFFYMLFAQPSQSGSASLASESILLPSGAELSAKVSCEARKGAVAMVLAWKGKLIPTGSGFLTLQIPSEIVGDLTVQADDKVILKNGVPTGTFVGFFTKLEFRRGTREAPLFILSGDMSGVDVVQAVKEFQPPDIRIRRKMVEGDQLALELTFPK